jgi:NAD(P)-dependent dehydrogenase (short-subunit alcohol dehydrogenase family)
MTEIKDLKGTIVLTGAAGGIGSGFITQFLKTAQASEYYCIYMYHPSFPGSLSSFLTKNAPKTHRYELVPLDLSLQSSIRTFASSLNARISSGSLPKIRNLLLIAGAIFNSPARDDGLVFSDEGIEMTFSVNYLSIFLLTLLLLESMDEEGSRIIFAASTTHDPSFGSNAYAIKKEEHKVLFPGVEELKSGAYQPVEGGDKFGAALRRYGCSKLCCVLWMFVMPFLSPTLSPLQSPILKVSLKQGG